LVAAERLIQPNGSHAARVYHVAVVPQSQAIFPTAEEQTEFDVQDIHVNRCFHEQCEPASFFFKKWKA
jgi:hypothetical protein